MDFTNLVIAPLATIITILVVIVSVSVCPRSEDRSLLPALVVSLLVNTLMVQPWYYTNSGALIEGIKSLLIFTTLGFAIGALFVLLTVKLIRRVREFLWPRA